RPGAPNAAASSFVSGIIREPIAGVRTSSPVPPATEVAVITPERTVDGILLAATATDDAGGPLTALTLPSLTVTVGEMVDSLRRVVGEDAAALVDWSPDPTIAAIVESWPARFAPERALGLGLGAPPDFDAVIREYLADL